MVKIPLFFLSVKSTERSVFETKAGEQRFFILDIDGGEHRLKVLGLEDGGLSIFEYKNDEWIPNAEIISEIFNGNTIREINEDCAL